MPYIAWHTAHILVLLSIVVSTLPQKTFDRPTTEATTSKRPQRRCPEPPVLKNGYYHGDKHSHGAIIKLVCSHGHEVIGPSSFQCFPVEGLKEHDPLTGRKRPKLAWHPRFSESRCENLNIIDKCWLPKPEDLNLKVDWGRNYTINSKVAYTCKTGYEVIGAPVRSCSFWGKWSPEKEPGCIQVYEAQHEQSTISEIILYISIPVLAVFALAVMCTMRKQCWVQNRQALTRACPSEHDDARYPQLLPAREVGSAGLDAHQYQPTAPPSYLLNSDEFTIPFIITENAPSAPPIQELPSYDDVTNDNSLPSFEVAERLHNSNTNLSHCSQENVH